MNNIKNIVILWSSSAQKIEKANQLEVYINAVALDIENNLLSGEVLNIFVNNILVDTWITTDNGGIWVKILHPYNNEKELILQAEHKKTWKKSDRKLVRIDETKWIKDTISREDTVEKIKKNGMLLGDIKYRQFNDDYFIVTKAVQQNGEALQFASERLKNDQSIVDESLNSNIDNIRFASEELQKRYNIELRSIINNIKNEINQHDKWDKQKTIYQNIAEKFKKNKELFEIVIEKYWIYYVKDEYHKFFFNDRSISIKAITRYPTFFNNLSESFRNDKDIASKVIKIHKDAIYAIWEALQNDGEFMLEASKIIPTALYKASEELKNNNTFMIQAIKVNLNNVHHIGKILKNNKAFVIELIKINPTLIAYMDKKWKEDNDIQKILKK